MTRAFSVLACGLLLAACGGGGQTSNGSGGSGNGGGGTLAPPVGTDCSLRARQSWAFQQINEWYLFPETLPASLDPAGFASVDAYVDALTAAARAQGKDRFFTHLTSIAQEEAFFSTGQTAAFGIRIQTDTVARQLWVADAYEGAPALAAGIDRGAEILAIGESEAALRTIPELIAAGGADAVSDAFGPSTAGVARVLQLRDAAGTRIVRLVKARFDIPPVSQRFGVRVFEDEGRRIGYLNLRTFIDTADPALRLAFQQFRAQGITEIVIDLRYNGGGLVDIAELAGDLLGANRAAGDVFSETRYRPSKAQFDETRRFRPQPQSVAPVRLAFITTSASASASELVVNGMLPWLRGEVVLVGADTFGKPVGQIARDRTACDDRLRIVAFATRNAAGEGDYFNGLASTVGRTCAAPDELARTMGDAHEGSTRAALDALAGRQCTPIGEVSRAQSLGEGGRRTLLTPARPDVAQREVPGSF
jgi:C-terminal processing protease CtpA/Prc